MRFPGPERYGAKIPDDERDALNRKIEELEAGNRDLFLEQGLDKWHFETLEEEHGTEHLTKLKSRKVFEHDLEWELKLIRGEAQEKRKGIRPLEEISLISIDLDHFKQINDMLGHAAGDEVLRKVSALLLESVREEDTVARFGGEELMILMRGADTAVAARHAEELRAKIEQLSFDTYPGLKVTASFGVASSKLATDEKTLLEEVDRALYAAKHAGRNRVEARRNK